MFVRTHPKLDEFADLAARVNNAGGNFRVGQQARKQT